MLYYYNVYCTTLSLCMTCSKPPIVGCAYNYFWFLERLLSPARYKNKFNIRQYPYIKNKI